MAKRLGKYNNYLSMLQKALENRKMDEINPLNNDVQRTNLAAIRANIPTRKHQYSVAIDDFEREYNTFIEKLKLEQSTPNENKNPVETNDNVQVTAEVSNKILTEPIAEVSTQEEPVVTVKVSKKKSKKSKTIETNKISDETII